MIQDWILGFAESELQMLTIMRYCVFSETDTTFESCVYQRQKKIIIIIIIQPQGFTLHFSCVDKTCLCV